MNTPEEFDVTPTFNPDDELEVAVTYLTEKGVRETKLLTTEEARRLASALGVAANHRTLRDAREKRTLDSDTPEGESQ